MIQKNCFKYAERFQFLCEEKFQWIRRADFRRRWADAGMAFPLPQFHV